MFKELALFSLFLINFTLAFDFLVWTSDDQVEEFDKNPWEFVRNSVKTASTENPVYLFAIQNTKVEDAAKKLNETTRPPFRQLKSDEKIKVPADANDAQYFLFNSFDDYSSRIPTLGDKFIVILSEPSGFDVQLERRKRVSLNEDEEQDRGRGNERQGSRSKPKSAGNRQRASYRESSGKSYAMPVVLPPYNRDFSPKDAEANHGTCLFYMESLSIYVFNKKSEDIFACGATIGSQRGNKFIFSSDSVDCIQNVKSGNKNEFSFDFEVTVNKAEKAVCQDTTLFTVEGPISVKLTFQINVDFTWKLIGVETGGFEINAVGKNDWLTKDLSVAEGAKASDSSIQNMDIGAPRDYNYACSQTKTAVFKTNSKAYGVGIAFGNIQIQPFDYLTDGQTVKFGRNTYDCIGTFSAGSLTGLIVTLVLAGVFIFGFLMLNSVQSMDRFDDPRKKQLIINAKD